MPVTIPSGRQMALKLKQVREVEKANTAEKLILKFAQPVEDVAALEIPVVLNSADSRDGLIQDLLADPGIQKQIQENLKKSPKK
jgi:soluble P-type ATPase